MFWSFIHYLNHFSLTMVAVMLKFILAQKFVTSLTNLITGRTERTQVKNQTQDLLDVRCQSLPLHHHGSPTFCPNLTFVWKDQVTWACSTVYNDYMSCPATLVKSCSLPFLFFGLHHGPRGTLCTWYKHLFDLTWLDMKYFYTVAN